MRLRSCAIDSFTRLTLTLRTSAQQLNSPSTPEGGKAYTPVWPAVCSAPSQRCSTAYPHSTPEGHQL